MAATRELLPGGSRIGIAWVVWVMESVSGPRLEGVSRSATYIYADWGPLQHHPARLHRTNMTKAILDNPIANKSFEETVNNTILLRRAEKPEEIGYTALFLASDDSAYITGTISSSTAAGSAPPPTSASNAPSTHST